MKVQIERFHLNGHTIGFCPQTQKVSSLQNSIIHSGVKYPKWYCEGYQSTLFTPYPPLEGFKEHSSNKVNQVIMQVK